MSQNVDSQAFAERHHYVALYEHHDLQYSPYYDARDYTGGQSTLHGADEGAERLFENVNNANRCALSLHVPNSSA